MTSLPLVLLVALTAPPEMNQSAPPAPRPSAAGTATVAPALSDAELQERVESYLGAIDTPVTAANWKELGARAVPILESVVRDTEALPSRRARAVEALSLIGGARAKQVVLEVARSDEEPFGVRAVALRGAPRLLSASELSTALRPILESAREAPVRATAAEVMAERGDPTGCPAVRAQVAREGRPERAQFTSAVERCTRQQP